MATKKTETAEKAEKIEKPVKPAKTGKVEAKAEKPVKTEKAVKVEKTEVKADEKLLKVTLIRSLASCKEKQIKTAQALGLTKINSFVSVKDNGAMRGMITVVSHLVKVEAL